MVARIEPAARPYEPDMEATLERLMPAGVEPLMLFRVLARNPRVFRRFMAGGLLDKGSLSLRDREIVIDRTTARCGSEYEWGVHVAFFAERARLDDAQVRATVALDGATAACWSPHDAVLMRVVDALVDTRSVPDELWNAARVEFSDEQLIEIVVLCGLYGMVSMVTNAFALPNEPGAPTFAARG